MDLSTMIVDMLRGDDFLKKFPESRNAYHNSRSPADPAVDGMHGSEMSAGAAHLLVGPEYTAYKREALSNGEPVLSPEQFKKAQAEGKL